MRTRLLKRLVFWVLQTLLVTWAAWCLLRWNYLGALEDMVPLRVPTLHQARMLMLAMTLVTGAVAAAISLIFTARVEEQPLTGAGGVAACTCVALWAYVFVARVGGDDFKIDTVFLGGQNYQVYALVVAVGVALLNGVLSLFAGALNRDGRAYRNGA